MTERTQFDYLLNAVLHAAQAEKPAEHGFGDKRVALFAYVRELEAKAGQDTRAGGAPSDEQIKSLAAKHWMQSDHSYAFDEDQLLRFARALCAGGARSTMVTDGWLAALADAIHAARGNEWLHDKLSEMLSVLAAGGALSAAAGQQIQQGLVHAASGEASVPAASPLPSLPESDRSALPRGCVKPDTDKQVFFPGLMDKDTQHD